MIIAIVDDGLCKKELVTPVLSFKIENNRVIKDNTEICCKSHGTFCGKIIETYGKVTRFIGIRILNNGRGTGENLICALNWCLHNKVNIINLSNGIDFYKTDYEVLSELRKICDLLLKKQIVIFAAHSNGGGYTVPALFPGIISIEQYGQPYFFHEPDYFAEGEHKIVIGHKKVYTDQCNSYACAYACAKFSRYGRLTKDIRPNPHISSYELKKYKKIIGKKLPDYITNELKWWNEKIENCIPNDNRIVVIKEKKELCLLLLSLEKKVIFCGKIPFFFKILLRARRIRYGEEPVWPRVLKNINCDLEIPFVFVNGDINDSMKAAFYLQKRLRNDGFACAVVSCVKYSYLSGVFYFSNYKMITNESVKRISRLLNLDIVIIVGKCNMPQNEDIKILFDEQKNMYVIDNTNRVRFVHSLDEIYSNIIDFYS